MLIRVELFGRLIHIELDKLKPDADPPPEPPFHIAPPMQVYTPEYVGFLPPAPGLIDRSQ